MPDSEGRPPETAPTPAPDRCPTCGGDLERIEEQPERYCPRCGVFVGLVEPFPTAPSPPEARPETPAPTLEPDEFLASFAAFSEEFDREAAKRRTEPPPTAEPSPETGSAPEEAPEAPPPTAPALTESAPVLPGPAREVKALPPAEPLPPPPEPEVAPSATPAEGAQVPAPVLPPEEPEPREAPEPEATEELEIFECPQCGAEVAPDAPRCPSCGTKFGAGVPEAATAPALAARERASPKVRAVAATAATRGRGTGPKPSRLDRAVFYAGAAQAAFGGSGLILGSFLHDFFRVPWIGSAYSAFGSVNLTALLFGAVFLVAGAGTMAAAARHGRRRTARAREG